MPVSVPYGADRGGRYAGLRYIETRAAIGELYRNGAFNLRALFRESLSAGLLDSGSVAEAFALAYDELRRSSRNQLANTHHRVGEAMQAEVLVAYEQARAGRGGPAPYRLSTRDAGGRLAAALASPEFFRGTYDGIGFANIRLLDRAARQWYRLNFGAYPQPGERPRTFSVGWRGLVVGAVGLGRSGPSKAFLMPRGFWREGAFGPTGRTPRFSTRGVRAWNFLDAGPEALGREIGPAYDRLYAQWFASAQRGAGPLARVRTVTRRPLPLPHART